MLGLDTRTPIRWNAPWIKEGERPLAFLFRAGSVIEREMLEAELAGAHGAAAVWDFQLRDAFYAGIDALLGADSADAVQLRELYAARAALEGDERLTTEEDATLASAEAVLTEHYPPFRALKVQASRRQMVRPVLAFQRFCVGWEGGVGMRGQEVAFARGPDGRVADAAMSAIDPLLLGLAGRQAIELLTAEGQAGN